MKLACALLVLVAVIAVTIEGTAIRCNRAGFVSEPTDCKAFHLCFDKGQGQIVDLPMKCPENMAFDPIGLYCSAESVQRVC